ncbi:adaptor protein (AP-1) complex beta-adaptin large subunit [Trichoderma reesei QM6a]|uniref:AP complex subunit beta n=2 Tax=Hypocrea jecorina TaxID=51453 RepID=G0RI78_HYPJQ|nr:adaptor protein (AP-1) complex beta-adaptin large subunit [Trichoderma reesei QM6a]EGR48910.1 adaptor protein (AP-1) complex beta-adaptin large subunit [Trichoderma reesei QM6a]ETS02579.1 Adaptor protein complex beta subunit [Trichoderma reesei RUT C-30]
MAVNRIRGAFAAPRKGETFELRAGLVSQYAYERKESIQKTIMAMTLGKDVSALFPDVLKNIATSDLDQKKLVYLYLMNYAKTHPDLCILAVNTFVQDSEDPNPLVRALAIRTMGCIRVDKMVDYMEEPLRKTLRDESPYVRKTAAICVAKLFDLNPAMCIENGFIETLQEMIGDPNPMVVANSVQALAEISETAPETRALLVTPPVLKKLLMAMNECTEWGRITILTVLADYAATDVKESEHICERVIPQFQHVNPSVVLAAVKVVFIHMKSINPELVRSYLKKMAPPLVTLVASAPEVQYVALRNIDLLLQAKPDILSKELRVFFCKYNDPPYVKMQKLEIMVRIANEKNYEQLLSELKEYALEVDMDFVRRAIKAIGQVAIKIEEASGKCVQALEDLLATKVNYVVQEVVVVIKDILRKYPGYEGVIPSLCNYIDELDEANARGSLIWIVGEYAEKISNAEEILEGFVDTFLEEFTQTQLQILTAVVKLFLKKPSGAQGLVQKVLQEATTNNDNPDIRDRAYVYWRLLSGDLEVAKNIVLSQKPTISTTMTSLPTALLEQLLSELSTLASVYHKPPEAFVGKGRFGADEIQRAAIQEQRQNAAENPIAASVAAAAANGSSSVSQNNIENLLDIDFDGAAPASQEQNSAAGTPDRVSSPATGGMADMMSMFDAPPAGSSGGAPSGGMNDLMNGFEGLNFGATSTNQPLPAAMQLHNAQGGSQPKKDSDDLLGLL